MDELKKLAGDIIDEVCDVIEEEYNITPKNGWNDTSCVWDNKGDIV